MTPLDGARTWVVPAGYHSPASAYPLAQAGAARLRRRRYTPGVYPMHGVRGHAYFQLAQALPVTSLEIGRRTWMVDDPLHWEGTQEFAERARPGRVLVAGLGLGLIVHALARRPDLTEIVVVERHPDVIALVQPLLPPAAPVTLVQADFWDYASALAPAAFPTIIVDLWVGHGPTLWRREVAEAVDALGVRFPAALTLFFGFQGHVDRLRELRRAVEASGARLRRYYTKGGGL